MDLFGCLFGFEVLLLVGFNFGVSFGDCGYSCWVVWFGRGWVKIGWVGFVWVGMLGGLLGWVFYDVVVVWSG